MVSMSRLGAVAKGVRLGLEDQEERKQKQSREQREQTRHDESMRRSAQLRGLSDAQEKRAVEEHKYRAESRLAPEEVQDYERWLMDSKRTDWTYENEGRPDPVNVRDYRDWKMTFDRRKGEQGIENAAAAEGRAADRYSYDQATRPTQDQARAINEESVIGAELANDARAQGIDATGQRMRHAEESQPVDLELKRIRTDIAKREESVQKIVQGAKSEVELAKHANELADHQFEFFGDLVDAFEIAGGEAAAELANEFPGIAQTEIADMDLVTLEDGRKKLVGLDENGEVIFDPERGPMVIDIEHVRNRRELKKGGKRATAGQLQIVDWLMKADPTLKPMDAWRMANESKWNPAKMKMDLYNDRRKGIESGDLYQAAQETPDESQQWVEDTFARFAGEQAVSGESLLELNKRFSPKDHAGKMITDKKTGQRYRSDGKSWQPIGVQ